MVPARRHRSADLDDALAFRIHHLNRLLRTSLGRFLERVDPNLTPERYFLLARISSQGPVRQAVLAEPALGDPPNVSRHVEALVAAGLVDRRPDPADRRSTLVSLTTTGRRLAGQLQEATVAERLQVFAGFDDTELDTLAGYLDRIEANVRPLLDRRWPG